jgi:uncharacterized protein (DUF433 family)
MQLPDFLAQDPDGFLRLQGHRIGVHHLLHFYNEGYSPEMLLEQFPTLSLALIHKTIAFYLENQPELDAYAAEQRDVFERQARDAPHGPSLAELRRRYALRRARAS